MFHAISLRRRLAVLFLLIGLVWAAGLVVGHRRLAYAALADCDAAEELMSARVVSLDRSQTSISPSQEAYLRSRFAVSPCFARPTLHVNVRWTALVCARVEAGHYTASLYAERKDTLYVCILGRWIPVHTFRWVMA